MSQNAKIISGIVVAVVVLVGGALYVHYSHSPGDEAWESKSGSAMTDDSGTLPSGSDASDQGISQDMQSINANLDASAQDSAQVDQGVNDASSAQ